MRRLLFLTYNFPPLGGAGIQRPVNFVRRLPDLGYDPVVLTGPAERRGDWLPLDPTLAAELPPNLEVHRVSGPQPGGPRGVRRWAEARMMLPSQWEHWWVGGLVERGLEVANGADAIYAWAQPYATVEAAARLAARLGRPWVADLSDPWALDEMWFYATAVQRRRELRKMRRGLAGAAAIVMSTPEAVKRVLAMFPEFRDRPVIAASEGFDLRAFETPAASRTDDCFRIVHTGSLHTALGLRHRRHRKLRRLLGGEPVPGVDLLTRSVVYLLQALEWLVEDEPALAGRIELHLVGALSEVDRGVVAGSSLVRTHGYVPHREAVALMRSADLLFLPMQDVPPGCRAGLVPCKTYEYLAARRPILAAVPEGDARDLLLEAGTAHVVAPSDTKAMAEVIRRLVTTRPKVPPVAPELLRRYEYRTVVRDVAGLFDDVLKRNAPGTSM